MLSAVIRAGWMGALMPSSTLWATAVSRYSVQIVVPALGDSISDGTISSVLKKSGDSVSENETIAQIETDKVTIDIKSPTDGTILGLVVQESDTVVPGQLVATVDDAAARAKLVGAAGTRPAAAEPSAQPAAPAAAGAPPPQPPAAAAAAPATPQAPSMHRVPGIRFPPRLTPDGRRVSSLPAAEATAFLQQWRAAAGGGSAAAAPAAASPGLAGQAAFAATPQHHAPSSSSSSSSSQGDVPSKFASSVTRLERMPGRRELSERDMELIELGGAAP